MRKKGIARPKHFHSAPKSWLSVLTLAGYLTAYGAIDLLHQFYHAQVDHQAAFHFAIQSNADESITNCAHGLECLFLSHITSQSSAPVLATASLQLKDSSSLENFLGVRPNSPHLSKLDSPNVPRGPPHAHS